jgi:ribosomal protein S12 methylthiotransferase accessory factor
LEFEFAELEISHYGRCCSHGLRLIDAGLDRTLFQTIGKGCTDDYARASAYGEMIERIQNLAWYTTLKYSSEPELVQSGASGFKYYPDEEPLDSSTFHERMSVLLKGDKIDRMDNEPPPLGVPFWNVLRRRSEYWPVRAMQVIVGSNGMCSGNNPAEALIHGICEVFERHVLKQFFLDPFCPPDVPLQMFEGHSVADDLRWISKTYRATVSVKDCSMERRLPVLGLLVRDRRGRYAFHLGSDPSPITALERCFTEMFQGGDICFKDESERPQNSCGVLTSDFWRQQLHLNIRHYGGHWPRNLLRQRPDYPFTGFEHRESVSDSDDLQYVLDVVRTAGFDLLVRDNSFTGYPSYLVYIPGISEMASAVDSSFVKEYLAFDRHIRVITNPQSATEGERIEASESINRYAEAAPSGQFNASEYLMYFPSHPIAAMPTPSLVALLRGPTSDGLQTIPECFACSSCSRLSQCSYTLVSDLWRKIRTRMISAEWGQHPDALDRLSALPSDCIVNLEAKP